MLTLAALLISSLAQPSAPMLSTPDIHGDEIVFRAEGDIWISDLRGGIARRLTSDQGVETNPRFSPDGTKIAFTASYEGGEDVYVMPVSGGAPQRLTYDKLGAIVQGWTPDGTGVLFRSARDDESYRNRLYVVPTAGGQAKQLPVPTGEFGRFMPDGSLVYVPASFEWANWMRYQGGEKDEIWHADLKGKFVKLVSDRGINTQPTICNGAVYYVSERSGNANLWLHLANGRERQVTHYQDSLVRYPSSDGKKIIFQHGLGLGVYDPASDKAYELNLNLASDHIHDRLTLANLAENATEFDLGPKGKRLLVGARGQILSVPVKNGEARLLVSQPGSRARFPIWSPDGKTVAFLSDAGGENEIWTVPAEGGEPKKLTTGIHANPFGLVYSPAGDYIAFTDREARIVLVNTKTGALKVAEQGERTGAYDGQISFSFSPDGKYLAFEHVMPNWIASVWLYEVSSGKSKQITSHLINSFAPAFDKAGKHLLFLADTNIAPFFNNSNPTLSFDNMTRAYLVPLSPSESSPFTLTSDEEGEAAKPKEEKPAAINMDLLSERIIQIPVPPKRYTKIFGLKDGAIGLASAAEPAVIDGASTLDYFAFNPTTKALTPVLSGINSVVPSFDGSQVLVAQGDMVAVVSSSDPGSVASGAVKLGQSSFMVDPRSERKEIFNESWRIIRDFFYDPKMHGLDWNAIRAKYAAYMPYVGDRTDLTTVLKAMLSELNTGHCYVEDPSSSHQPNRFGYLGADVSAVGGAWRIDKIYRGDDFSVDIRSPLSEPGLNVKLGDFIVAINGQKVDTSREFQAGMIGLANQAISLQIADKPSGDHVRTIRVKTISNDRPLHYWDWVNSRIQYVNEKSGGKLGYVHMLDMTLIGAVGMMRGHLPNVDKEAMIYDTRNNGGGNISSLMLSYIYYKPQYYFKPRFGDTWTRESWANPGPQVAICNGGNFSDGELFIETWKRLGLGPVIGKRTGGGEVGSGNGFRLVDGGRIWVPNYAAFGDGRWIIEGHGADPTVEVDQDPTAVMHGADPQLDKAIEILLNQIKKKPTVKPKVPPFPNKATSGSDLIGKL